MEYNLQKMQVPEAGWLLDTVAEEPVDADLTLPDYCPDIERILKCTMIPQIYMANISGDCLNIDGNTVIRVMYLDGGKGCLRSYEHTVPFSHSFPLKDSPDRCAIYADAKPEYINCRAQSPRKLSLHGAFSLYARVAVEKPLEYFAYDGDDLQVKTASPTVSSLSGLCCDIFTLTEDAPMNGKPEVSAVLSHRLTTRITELKAIRNKIMVTAEGRLELMYTSGDTASPECMTYAFPISHIADCEGVEDGDLIDGRLDVMTCDLSVGDDALGGSSVLSLEMKLCFNAICRREREITLMEDAFSTECEVQPKVSPLTFCTKRECLRFTDVAKENLALDGDTFARVIDVHCERMQVSAAISGGAPLLSAKAQICVLYENAEGELKHLSRDVDFDYNPSVENCDSIENAAGCIESLSYRIIDERTIELRAEIAYRMTVCCQMTRTAVTAVSADDDAPHHQPDSALILYYADRGEQVWDISKRFCSRPADILAENELDSDTLPDSLMLLIPT